jgi:hypothetical protein
MLLLYMPTISICAHCFIYANYFYICPPFLYKPNAQCPMCLYMPTMFKYAHYVLICPLFFICPLCLDRLTVFTYAHCRDICSLSLHMLLKREIQTQIPYICLNNKAVYVYISYEWAWTWTWALVPNYLITCHVLKVEFAKKNSILCC